MKPTVVAAKTRSLTLRNRQRARRVDLRHLRRIATTLLDNLVKLDSYELTVQLVGARKMTQLNEEFLHHEGSTDVITFDYSEATFAPLIVGEIVICVEEAALQAARWRTSWQAEIARYLVHGVLHLLGYDDQETISRQRMKSAENRLLRSLSNVVVLSKLQPVDKI